MRAEPKDIEVLRGLADKYMGYAMQPANAEKRKLWKSLNSLNMERPMVLMDQLPWHEMDVNEELVCKVKDPFWREVENDLRRIIYRWEHMPADMVIEPCIDIPMALTDVGFGVKISEEIAVSDSQNTVVGHMYKKIIEDYEDIDKIQTFTVLHDETETERCLFEANTIFKGIAPVKPQGRNIRIGLLDDITLWMGITEAYFELADRPEFVHKILEKMTECMLKGIESINDRKIADSGSNTCHCSYTYNDDGRDKEAGTTDNGWGFGLAQLFSSCSPAYTEEFEVPYAKKIFEKFHSIYYGCCERLDDRIDIIAKLPNVRKISCSPWSDRDNFADQIGKNYVMSNKPNPAFLTDALFDVNAIKEDLRKTKKTAESRGVNLEFILKDVSTCCYKPDRLWEWAQAAIEVVSE